MWALQYLFQNICVLLLSDNNRQMQHPTTLTVLHDLNLGCESELNSLFWITSFVRQLTASTCLWAPTVTLWPLQVDVITLEDLHSRASNVRNSPPRQAELASKSCSFIHYRQSYKRFMSLDTKSNSLSLNAYVHQNCKWQESCLMSAAASGKLWNPDSSHTLHTG